MSSHQRLRIYSHVGVGVGSPYLSLGLDALHAAQPDTMGWGCRGQVEGGQRAVRVVVIPVVFITRLHPPTAHMPRCEEARLRLMGTCSAHTGSSMPYLVSRPAHSIICHFCSLLHRGCSHPGSGLILPPLDDCKSSYLGQEGA